MKVFINKGGTNDTFDIIYINSADFRLVLLTLLPTLRSFSNPHLIYSVFFRAVSWLRDSHGLFDYESRNIVKMSLKTQSQGQIIRNEDQIDFAKPDHVINPIEHPNGRSLCQLKKDEGKYRVLKYLYFIFVL